MKNHERYKDEIMRIYVETGSNFALIENELKPCAYVKCGDCKFSKKNILNCFEEVKKWLNDEYQEPRIQEECKHLKVDDKVLVSHNNLVWYKRHFHKYEDGQVYAFSNGTTSWTDTKGSTCWEHAKLPKNENDLKKGDT